MNDIAKVLTEEELAELGVDNPVVDALLQGRAQADPRGRAIISYRQYLELSRSDQRLDNYMLRMKGPTGVGLVQASKYAKWFGEGFRPIEEFASARSVKDTAPGQELTVYRCSEKYPECSRFFDSPKSRSTHWGLAHENKLKGRRDKQGNAFINSLAGDGDG